MPGKAFRCQRSWSLSGFAIRSSMFVNLSIRVASKVFGGGREPGLVLESQDSLLDSGIRQDSTPSLTSLKVFLFVDGRD